MDKRGSASRPGSEATRARALGQGGTAPVTALGAEKPAGRGDFRGAVQAMGDTTVVQQILAATKTIENACRGAG